MIMRDWLNSQSFVAEKVELERNMKDETFVLKEIFADIFFLDNLRFDNIVRY